MRHGKQLSLRLGTGTHHAKAGALLLVEMQHVIAAIVHLHSGSKEAGDLLHGHSDSSL